VLVVVELTVEVDVDVYMVKKDVAVTVGVATMVVVEVITVVGLGVVTCATSTLPVAGGLTHESKTIPEARSNTKVNVAARELRLKTPTS
jgi:hypothetical protein